MQIDIYQGTSKLYDFHSVLSASLVDRLSGERTLDFSVLAPRSQKLLPGMTAWLEGQAYTIVRVARQITNGLPVTTAQCEHISYLLNDEQYNLVTFVYGRHLENDHYDASITRQSELAMQRQDYQSALQRTTYYASVLGMSEEGVSSYFVGANLREIQRKKAQGIMVVISA